MDDIDVEFDDMELYEEIQQRVEDDFIFEYGNQDLDLHEDLIEQQERDDDCILELVSDADDEDENPDFEEWFDAEETQTACTPDSVNFEKETIETFKARPARGGHERPVSFTRNAKNVGIEIETITEQIEVTAHLAHCKETTRSVRL